MPQSDTSSSAASVKSIAEADPVTRNALRYTVSAREYELLHQYLIRKAPILGKRAPSPQCQATSNKDLEDYNATTIRLSSRLFLTTYSALQAWDFMSNRIFKRPIVKYVLFKPIHAKQMVLTPSRFQSKTPIWKSGALRYSLSLSTILFFHRLLYRFFLRLRESLRSEDARPFRRRNPRVAQILTSKLAPPVGASLAGFFLGLSPADQARITITIYASSRSLEFLYNALDNKGYFKAKPWWIGSWMLFPVSCGQLLHSFVFDRDCFPSSYGDFIIKRSPEYTKKRPTGRSMHLPWPSTNQVVDSLATISNLKWPSFVSPILFPSAKTLPKSLTAIAPVTDPAHPAIKQLSCAVLHPHDPSCLRTYLRYYLQAFPIMARYWTIIYGVFAILRFRTFLAQPVSALNSLAARILRTSLVLTSAIGTAWGSICLLQNVLPRHLLPTSRWLISGFLAGMWALVERKGDRSLFLYSARMSSDSLWKVGKKRGWWRGVRSGDVLLFVTSLALINVVYERDPKAVDGAVSRKALGVFRGDGWVDRAASVAKGKGKERLDNSEELKTQ